MSSSELPGALRGALSRELEGASRRALAESTAATTAAYRGGRGSAQAIRTEADALAYAVARLPATYAAVSYVLEEAARLAPDFAPSSLLDAGSGPGGGSWAAVEAFPGLTRIVWRDASAPFLTLARRLAEGGPGPLADADAQRVDLTADTALPVADLVLVSYALAELAPARQAEVLSRLWGSTAGVLALVEPGTPAGFERLRAARDALIQAGARVLAPCPHHNACPMAGQDWCHFSVRLPRSREHRLAKSAEASYEDEKFAYLLAARPHVQAGCPYARVLARPAAGKPGIHLKLCTPDGLELRFVPRRDKPAHAKARRLDWGDALG